MSQKARGLFSLRNFRGLDKENKLLKVQSFRATDGYNFIIDSETLKTRPSFSIAHNPNFFLEQGDYLIDYDVFGDIYVYITRRHIYILSGNNVYNEKSTQIIKSPFLSTLDFANLKPLFQEEKEVLFIFCLNEIYVVSKIKNEDETTNKFVLYDLKEKPNNPFNQITETLLWNQFEDLPTPYVPTLFIGNNALDDVNLLSNKSKYQLFAEVPKTTVGSTTYVLPTYYNKEKHGLLEEKNVEVSFYKNRFDDYEVFPVFMGVKDEDWFGDIVTVDGVSTAGDYGIIKNTTEPIVIENIFFAVQNFEYSVEKDNQQNSVILKITEKLSLPKKDFFNMIVKASDNETVFEYLMREIKLNQSTITENEVFVFNLLVQSESIFKDKALDNVIERKIQQKVFPVYVQLKKFEDDTFTFTQETTLFNSVITSDLSEDFIDYKPILPLDNYFEINDGVPILFSGKTQDIQTEFLKIAKNKIIEQEDSIVNGSRVMVEAKLFTSFFTSSAQLRTIVFPSFIEENSLEVIENTLADGTIIGYPTIDNVSPSFPVKDFSGGVLGNDKFVVGDSFSFSFGTSSTERVFFENLITEYLQSPQSVEDGFTNTTEYGIFKIRMRRENGISEFIDFQYDPENEDEDIPLNEDGQTPGRIVTFYRTAAVVVKVFINNPLVQTEHRYSFTYLANFNKEQVPLVDISEDINNLYEISFKEDFAFIELKVKDYFFDYKNEPSIEVLVTLDSNLDYENISKSTFGTTFGSENRLFLAGNPKFKNIDRFNVSNDLLGDNVKNQSYELTYFPSKNYRVMGGKGAINGYVIATDNQLYVTKENYPNDSKLFIRERLVDENGRLSYREFKTNITKTPINNRCIVRFYNDILILAKDGLYGIEISQNVLTDERLVKLRSGFINRDIVNTISTYDIDKVFILENNVYMYIFFGNKCYVADSRYVGQASNSSVENISYEIVEWKMPITFVGGKINEDQLYLIEENNNLIYSLSNTNSDAQIIKNGLGLTNSQTSSNALYAFVKPNSFVNEDASKYVFKFTNGYQTIGVKNTDYTITIVFSPFGNLIKTVSVINTFSFIGINDGDEIFIEDINNGLFIKHVISDFQSSNFTSFVITPAQGAGGSTNHNILYKSIANLPMYVTHIYTYNTVERFNLSFRKPDEITLNNTGITPLTTIKFNSSLNGSASETVDMYRELVERIELKWVSAITDFGNSQMEKTMFRANLFATKKEEENSVVFGYRTMRRLAGFSDAIDLSNNFNFEQVNYNLFNLATFDTVATSLPMKENNFLYIQFTLDGYGKIEMNAIEIIYKMNRMLKSIG
jgi:hypothetical protein